MGINVFNILHLQTLIFAFFFGFVRILGVFCCICYISCILFYQYLSTSRSHNRSSTVFYVFVSPLYFIPIYILVVTMSPFCDVIVVSAVYVVFPACTISFYLI